VEIQALVDECHGGHPRRVTLGLEQNRLAMLLAVLHRHGEERLREAAKHGFKQAIVPRANLPRRGGRVEGLEVRGVSRLVEVMGDV